MSYMSSMPSSSYSDANLSLNLAANSKIMSERFLHASAHPWTLRSPRPIWLSVTHTA